MIVSLSHSHIPSNTLPSSYIFIWVESEPICSCCCVKGSTRCNLVLFSFTSAHQVVERERNLSFARFRNQTKREWKWAQSSSSSHFTLARIIAYTSFWFDFNDIKGASACLTCSPAHSISRSPPSLIRWKARPLSLHILFSKSGHSNRTTGRSQRE